MSRPESAVALRGRAHLAAAGLACGVIALQIAYPLTPEGRPRDLLTIGTVIVFFSASTAHAVLRRGVRFAGALVAVTAGGGFVVEVLGVTTGWPFGSYSYTGTLGPSLLGVPVIIPLAWTMMGYPAYTVARRIAGGWVGDPAGPNGRPDGGTRSRHGSWRRLWAEALLGGWALASWDLFLDPQMVDAGHWVWESGGPAVLGIPISNFAGWLLVSTLMMALLGRVDPARGTAEARGAAGRPGRRAPRLASAEKFPRASVVDDWIPYALYLWVYGSSVLAHVAFFGLPGSALLGGVGMGVVVILFVLAVRR